MINKVFVARESLFQRALEVIPGFFIWILILSPFWAGRFFPQVMAEFLIIVAVYWLYRAMFTTLGTSIGIYRARKDMRENWLQKCLNLSEYSLPDPEELPVGQLLPKHLLVYAQLTPQFEVLRTTFEGIKSQNYPLELIHIAVSFEERAIVKMEEGIAAKVEGQLREAFPELSERLMFFVHPDGLEGEVIGAAANRAWGAKNAVKVLEEQGEIVSDFLVTAPDEDIVFHKEYLAACSYTYLTSAKRKQKFYQTALYTFNNNYWQVPVLIRVLVSSLTIPVLSSSTLEKHQRETFSCYSLNLEVLRKVDYWDTSYGIDDTPFYWRPYFYFNGDWECEVFFIPLSADAVYNPDYVKNHQEQYKQYVRWGWGIVAFPIGLKGLLKHKGIPFAKRVGKILHMFEFFIFWKVIAYLLTFAIPIILLLNPDLNELVIWYTIPNTLSKIMGISVIFLIPNTIYKAYLAPPKPETWSYFRYYATLVFEAPLTIITIFIYSTLPFVEASTRMMVGQKEAKSVTWSTKVRE